MSSLGSGSTNRPRTERWYPPGDGHGVDRARSICDEIATARRSAPLSRCLTAPIRRLRTRGTSDASISEAEVNDEPHDPQSSARRRLWRGDARACRLQHERDSVGTGGAIAGAADEHLGRRSATDRAARGEIPAVPDEPQRAVPLEIDPSPDFGDDNESATNDQQPTNDRELVVILGSNDDDNDTATRPTPAPSRVVVSCEGRVQPESLQARIDRLNDLAVAAGNANDRAELHRAAERLADARREVERETTQLESAIEKADDIYAGAVSMATNTDRD